MSHSPLPRRNTAWWSALAGFLAAALLPLSASAAEPASATP